MKGYNHNHIKDFLIIEDLCSSKKSYDDLKKLYEALLLSEVATLDWQKLENRLIYATPTLKSKEAISKLIYNFLKPKYGEKVATRIAWLFRKYFKLLFMKADFGDFYHLTQEGLWLLEHLGKFEKYNKSKSKQSKQLDLFQLFSSKQKGVSGV